MTCLQNPKEIYGHEKSKQLLVSLVLIPRFLDENLIILVAVLGVLAVDGYVLLSRYRIARRVQVAVHILHEQLVVELLPSFDEFVGLGA